MSLNFLYSGNFGISRDADRKWINHYNVLFCILNDQGQIVTWRLTPNVMSSTAEALLVGLSDQLIAQGVNVKEF